MYSSLHTIEKGKLKIMLELEQKKGSFFKLVLRTICRGRLFHLIYLGFLGVGNLFFLSSISRISRMVGRSFGFSCVHKSPIPMHLRIIFRWLFSHNDGSNNFSICRVLFLRKFIREACCTFQAWEQNTIQMIKEEICYRTCKMISFFYVGQKWTKSILLADTIN